MQYYAKIPVFFRSELSTSEIICFKIIVKEPVAQWITGQPDSGQALAEQVENNPPVGEIR